MIASSVADSMIRMLSVRELNDRTQKLDAIELEIDLADNRLRALVEEYSTARDDRHRLHIMRTRAHTLQWLNVLTSAMTELLDTVTE